MTLSNEVQAALIGAFVAGVLTLAGSLVSLYFEARRTREESRRRDAEWRREKCNEAYSEAIYYLFKLQVSSQSQGPSDKEVRQHLSEAQRFLALLQAYHPDESMRQELARVALDLQGALAASGNLSFQAASARRLVKGSLQSTWSPKIRGEIGGADKGVQPGT
jgi:hypothetical protein